MTFAGLGIYPTWQYSTDPKINPKLNPWVTFPAGMSQTTVQPMGPYYQGPEGLSGRGLGDFTDTISSIGSVLILGLALVGGWTTYKYLRKKF